MKVKNYSKLLLAASALLLVFSGVEGSRAALNVTSNTFSTQLVMPRVGVEILEENEKGKLENADGVLHLPFDEHVILGKTYEEHIAAENQGTIPEYVRATVVAYWISPKGKKDLSVDPSTIKLTFADGWTVNEKQSTPERTVLYYHKAMGVNENSVFVTGISLDESLANKCKVVDNSDGSKSLVYAYNGYNVVLKATVDCVQAGGAMDAEAIEANWGVRHTDEGVKITLADRN